MKNGKHYALWMIAGCILPFLVLFLLPAFGLDSGLSIAAFLVLMIGCHLMHMAIHYSASDDRRPEGHHHEGD